MLTIYGKGFSMYHNKILIICTTFNFPAELKRSLASILAILNSREDVLCTIIDNLSKDEAVHELLDSTSHPNLNIIKKDINYGKAPTTNAFIKETLSHQNCPRVLISMDPDMEFQPDDFNKLIEALDTIPNLGMLGMRYIDNGHNPERSVWWPAKTISANNKSFKVRCPVFANVAGGLFGVQGYVLSHYLNFKLFPKTKNEENFKKGYIKRAGSDDAFLYDHLKKHKLIQGYLEGTQIAHLKSPPQTKNQIK